MSAFAVYEQDGTLVRPPRQRRDKRDEFADRLRAISVDPGLVEFGFRSDKRRPPWRGHHHLFGFGQRWMRGFPRSNLGRRGRAHTGEDSVEPASTTLAPPARKTDV